MIIYTNLLLHYPFFQTSCVSETRLKGDSLINVLIPGYNFVHSDSVTNAGGVAIYVSSKFQFTLDHKLNLNVNGCEDLWLNVCLSNNAGTRPPWGGIQWPRGPWTLGGPWASGRPLASAGPTEGPWAQEGPIEMTLRNQHVKPEDLFFFEIT